MRAELLSAVVQPSNAAVFAHLSPEESPAAWHFGPVGGRSDPSQVAPAATAALSAGFAAAFRREFRPVFFELVADAELQGHRRWAGELLGSVRAQSALYFRWLLLHDAVERREAAAARRFAYVLRLRPDILPGCALRPPSVAQLLEPGLDAVALSDQLVLLRRSAVRVALRAYVAAPASPHCRLAPELCVDALLLLANLARARPAGKRRARAQRVDVSIDAAPKRARLVAPPPQPHRRQTAAPPGSLRAGRPGHRRAEGRAGVLAISVQPQTGANRRRDGGNLRADADALLGAVRRVAAARGVSLPGVWARAGQGIERQRVGACEVMLSALADDGNSAVDNSAE